MIDRNAIREEIAPNVQAMQIICFALAMGPIVFAVILLSGMMSLEEENAGAFLMPIGIVSGVIAVVAGPPIGQMVGRANAKQSSPPSTLPAEMEWTPSRAAATGYQTGFVVSSAVAEGAAFINLIAYMLEGSPWSIGMAGVLVFVNLLKWPVTEQVVEWVARQLREQADNAALEG